MQAGGHIFLSGFMGSGKSLLGRKTAPLLGLPFEDLDTYIEQRETRGIDRIFAEEGEAGFRAIETRCLREVIQSPVPLLIALGGGTVCFGNNLDEIKAAGLLVYIELSPAALAQRLKKNGHKRPLLQNLAEAEMVEKISSLMAARENYYRQAHLAVNGVNLTPQRLCKQILEFKQVHSAR